MRRDAAKEDYLRTVGIRLLRVANGLVMQDREGFLRKVREAIEAGNGPLTRPVTAGESAVAGHPLPEGEGSFLIKNVQTPDCGPLVRALERGTTPRPHSKAASSPSTDGHSKVPAAHAGGMIPSSTERDYFCYACIVLSTILIASCGSGSSPSPSPTPTPPQPNCSNAITGSPTDYSTSPTISGCPVFPTDNLWNTDISNFCVDPNSDQYIASINQDKQYLHPDFGSDPTYGIPYIVVPGTQQPVSVTFNQYPSESDFGTSGSGCTVTSTSGCYPFPPDAPVEGGSNSTGDRHVLTLQADPTHSNCTLYEVWEGVKDANDNNWTAANGAIFNLYSDKLRPDGWTSADAAGLPILPGLVRYEEVAAGEIKHAVRFTVSQTQAGFIHPATHYASSSNNPALPPMGLRLRLKASYDISSYTGQALVILTALKKYGMMVADNGSSWYITGAPDPSWNDSDLDQLKNVPGSAFEVVVTGIIQNQ